MKISYEFKPNGLIPIARSYRNLLMILITNEKILFNKNYNFILTIFIKLEYAD